ncbi:MAG: hypothetical protein CMN29_06560 [Sandaracinus sp.]|nr:hypothetical protein [Sandaracinus sp.]
MIELFGHRMARRSWRAERVSELADELNDLEDMVWAMAFRLAGREMELDDAPPDVADQGEAAALQDHPDPRVRDLAWLAHVVGDVWGDFLVDTGDGGAGHDEPWSEAELPVEPVGGGTGFEDGPSGED